MASNRRRTELILKLAVGEFLLIYVAGATWLLIASETTSLLALPELLMTPEAHLFLAPWAILTIGLQAMLLLPVRKPTPKSEGRCSVLFSLAGAGLATALLVSAAIWAVMELLQRWEPFMERPYAGWALLGMILTGWCIFTPLLYVFGARTNRESLISRVASMLFIGTMIETLAIIPVDVMVRKRTNCYCGSGTFLALTATGTVGLITMGPALLMPLVMRRRKRWWNAHCDACGYDMTGALSADRCPECGAGWRAAQGAAK